MLALDVGVGEAVLPDVDTETWELEVDTFDAEVVALTVMVPLPVAFPLTPLTSMPARRDEK